MSQSTRATGYALVLLLGTLLLSAWPTEAADVRLRESLLQQQRNRATIQITAVVDHIGKSAHSLSKDCDLHVPLRSRDIRLPLVGELKNDCSERPADSHRTYWSHQVYEEIHGRAAPVAGVFRIWLEHPPSGNRYHSETRRVDWYKNSGPKHVVELHPITRIGTLDFIGTAKAIEEGSRNYEGYGASNFRSILRKELTIRRLQSPIGNLVRIVGRGTGRNHWNLEARVDSQAQTLADGHRLTVTILRNGQPMIEATGLPAVTVAGTAADAAVQNLTVGARISFQALIWMDLNPILSSLSASETTIPMPVEFILLDVS